ncbi:glycosyl transferase, partial [Gilbertella persicaria]|uniref:glycosyl transferase n=1 Tax=Gilbertella persicaria TaxID=101096 RepID=UPI002220135B
FDEVHFGKYITEYMTRSFFFDIHPPLAKLLLALVAWMSGYKGDFDVDEVGSVYTEQIPFVAMRTTSALMGALGSLFW